MPRRKHSFPDRTKNILIGATGVFLVGLLFFIAGRSPNPNVDVQKARRITAEVLKDRGVRSKEDLLDEGTVQRRSGRTQWVFLEQRYRVKPDFVWDSFRETLAKQLARAGLSISKSSRRSAPVGWVLTAEVGRKKTVLYRLILEQPMPAARGAVPGAASFSVPLGKGKIAVILDDWGYTLRQLPALKGIGQPLTVAVLPALPHSADVAKAARQSGHEVMLHLPMEPLDPKAPRENRTILTGMSKKEILEAMDVFLSSVPFVAGINNHQGSKATADPQLMETVLEEAKRRGLFFVDSKVTDHSVCGEAAKRLKVRFGQRAVFLDNDENPGAIRRQVLRLAAQASKSGGAIAIGHDRPATLKVLQQTLPELEKAGYEVVHASELTGVPE